MLKHRPCGDHANKAAYEASDGYSLFDIDLDLLLGQEKFPCAATDYHMSSLETTVGARILSVASCLSVVCFHR